jgi:hypothetical protein
MTHNPRQMLIKPDVSHGSKCEILCTSRCLKTSRNTFVLCKSQLPPLARTDETTMSLLDCPKSGKTRQINLLCRCDNAGLRALRSAVDPGLDQFPGGFLTSRSGFPARSGIPPQATRSSLAKGSCNIARSRPPLRLVSFSWRQMSPIVLPSQAIDSGARPQRGWPGML